MKISEIIQRVQSLYSKGVQSDDTRLSSRNIYSKMVSVRAMLLLQKAKKRQLISLWSYQTLTNVIIEDGKTKYKLPKPISGLLDSNIDYVLSEDGDLKFSEVTKQEARHLTGNKFTSGLGRFVIDDGYAYFYGSVIPSSVNIRLLCEDPAQVYTYNGNALPSTFLNSDFPIETGYVDTLIDLVAKELIADYKNQKQDIKNDDIEE